MKISELMTKNPCTVTPETSVSDAARLMQQEDIGIVPVVERVGGAETRGRLVGVITDRDITIRHVAEGRSSDTPVRDVMSGGVQTARPDDSVETVMKLMGEEQIRRIPIVDERGSLVGVVSQADLIRKVADAAQVERTVKEISQPGGSHQN